MNVILTEQLKFKKIDSDNNLSNLTHFESFFGSIEKEKSAQPRRLSENSAHINYKTYTKRTNKNS